jgi:hypothetical protein
MFLNNRYITAGTIVHPREKLKVVDNAFEKYNFFFLYVWSLEQMKEKVKNEQSCERKKRGESEVIHIQFIQKKKKNE